MWRYLKYMYSSPKKCIVRAKNAYVKVWDQGYIWRPKCWVKLFALKSQFMWMWMWPWWTKILNKPDTKTVECFSCNILEITTFTASLGWKNSQLQSYYFYLKWPAWCKKNPSWMLFLPKLFSEDVILIVP